MNNNKNGQRLLTVLKCKINAFQVNKLRIF